MTTPWYHDIGEWRSRLDGVTETTNGIRGLCPAHADSTPSLDVDERGGKVVWKCRAGCDQEAVLDALGGKSAGPSIVLLARNRPAPRPAKRKAPPPDAKADPLGWYADYIGVDRSFLDGLPLSATADGWVSHDFPGLGVSKQRQAGTIERRWSPADSHNPAIWPLDDAMPAEILLTEGETDAIALRAHGFDAYSSGSASGVPSVSDFRALARRGVTTVFVGFDADEAGQKGAEKAMEHAMAAGLSAARIVPPDYDSLAGTGKDWREWALAGGSPDDFPESNLGQVIKSVATIRAETPATVPWAAFPVAYFGGVSVLAGPPKGGKSTILGHLARCAETGEKFLGEFDVKKGTPVLLLTEEHGVPVVMKTDAFGLSAVAVVQRGDAVRAGWGLADSLAAAARWVKSNPREVVVIDTLAVWAGIENENDAGEATAAIETIRHALADRGAAVILVHHTRKGGGIAGEATRGSGAIAASCDVQAELTYFDAADATDSRRWLTVRGRVMDTTRLLLAYDTAAHAYSVADSSDEDNAELLSWIEGVPRPSDDADGASRSDLEAMWGVDGRRRIDTLVRMKLLRRSDDKVKVGRGLEYRYWRSDVAFASDRGTGAQPLRSVQSNGVESEAGVTPPEGVPTHETTDAPMHKGIGRATVQRSREPTIKGQRGKE